MIKTNILAIHSIQSNMLGTELINKSVNVLLPSGKTLIIVCANEAEATEINNIIHYYPSIGSENNSMDMKFYFHMKIIQ